jgi:MFS family permease
VTLYASSLGASLAQVALVVGVQSAVALAAGLGWGRLADRVGRRRPFVLGAMAALAACDLAIGLAPTWPLLVPLHALRGVAMGAYQVASLALMGDIVQGHARRGRMVSGFRMSQSLAFSIAIVVSGFLSEAVGLRGSFLFAAGVHAAAFLVALQIREPPRGEPSAARYDFLGLLRGPILPLLLLALCQGVPFSAVFSVWPIWVAEQQGHGRAVFAQLWGLAALVEVPCMLLAGYLVDRVGRRPTFVFGLVGFSVLYLIYSTEPPLAGLVGAQVLRGFAFAAFHATALTMAIELAPPEARGRASSLYTSAQGLAQIGGSWVGGPLAAGIGFRSLFVVAAATVLLGAAYSYVAVGRPRSRASA